MIEIESGIPAPAKKTGYSKYPWEHMKVGDSFFVPKRIPGTISAPKRLKTEGWKFTMRAAQNGEEQGVRVWRIA